MNNNTDQAVDLFDKRANDYQARFMDVSLYHAGLDRFCERAAPDAGILELACGPGNLTRYLLDKRPDFQILATDLSPNMLELASANNPTAEVMSLDCRAARSLGRTFDAVVCGFGLPYLTREEAVQFIADAAAVLRPGGLLYVSTMEDAYENSRLETSSKGDQLFIHYHEAGYLTAALAENGLQLVDLERIPSEMSGGQKVTDLVLLAEKS